MRRLNLLYLAILMASSLAFVACSSSDNGDEPAPGPNPPSPVTPVTPSDMKMAKLSGFVTDLYGNALSGVTVTSGTATATTDGNGVFALSQVAANSGRAIVTFSKEGYVSVTRSLEFSEGAVWNVAMTSEANYNFDSGVGKQFKVNPYSQYGEMKVDIPAGAVAKEDGSVYDGNVNVSSAYLSPKQDNFDDLMPGGDLVAIRSDNSTAQLVSYGMVSVSMTDDSGNKLQLKEGQEATLTFPAPEGLEAHDSIPLWSFNETTGIWEEEGMAYKQTDGTYVGTVKHFSWHNLDYPESRATLSVTVKDQSGRAIPYIRVIIGQTSKVTDANGKASTYVPTNTSFDVSVNSNDYGNYDPVVSENVNITTAGTTKEVTLTLPNTNHLSGTITHKGVGTQASLYVSYGNGETPLVLSGIDGKYYMNLPVGYTGAATIHILALDGQKYEQNINISEGDIVVNYEIEKVAVATGSFSFSSGSFSKAGTLYDYDATALGGVMDYEGGLFTVYSYRNEGGSMPQVNRIEEGKFDLGYSYGDVYFYMGSYDCTYTVENNVYRFKATNGSGGTVSYSDASGYYQTGSITVDMPITKLGKMTKTGSAPSPDSWVVQPSGKSPKWSFTITESAKLGNSWMLFYDACTLDEYKAIVAAAQAAYGKPYSCYDDEVDNWMKSYMFVSGKRVIQYEFLEMKEGSAEEPYPQDVFHGHHGRHPLTIKAYSDVNVLLDYFNMMH